MRGLSPLFVAGFVFAACHGAAPRSGSRPDGGPLPDGGSSSQSVDGGEDAGDVETSGDAGDVPDGSVPVSPDGGSIGSDAGSGPTLTLGAADHILLIGTIVTPADVFEGEVLVEADAITCVQPGNTCATAAGAQDATIIDTKGIIAPGLIDTHNHILFDIFDSSDWAPARVYTNHNQWTTEPRYEAMLDVKQCLADASEGKPTWCPAEYSGTGSLECEMDKWGELKGLIAGTTSIVGLPGISSACFGSVARSIDVSQNGLGSDEIQTSALFPPSRSSGDGVCGNVASGKTDAYLIHCGEGTDTAALQEFATLGTLTTTDDCLYDSHTVITHGVAFTAAEFAIMHAHDMKLTWSPASNVSLYGTTTDIPTALDAGVLVTLAPDWSMGGSQNLLDEIRFADSWDNTHWNDQLSAKDLVLMTTTNAAQVLGLGGVLGTLQVGLKADLFVVTGDRSNPYDAIAAATPLEVRLTMVGGQILYGDTILQAAGANPAECETLALCGAEKFLCIAQHVTNDKLSQKESDISLALESALENVDTLTLADGWNFAPLTPLAMCR